MRLDRYFRAGSTEECVQYIAEWGDGAAFLAGGTDLIPKMRQGKRLVSTVIDLRCVPGLARIECELGGVFVGAMCRLSALQKEERLTGPMAALRRGAGHVSSMQIRNMATLGGNICNASPAADTVPALLLLDAVARVTGINGARELPLESLFSGPGMTNLRRDELLTGVFLPYTQVNTGAAYRKYAIRGDSDVSIVGAGALITLDADGLIVDARISLSSVGSTPLRMRRMERLLVGRCPETAIFRDVAYACAESCEPVTDQRATSKYRREMVRVWMEDALKDAAASADKVARVSRGNLSDTVTEFSSPFRAHTE